MIKPCTVLLQVTRHLKKLKPNFHFYRLYKPFYTPQKEGKRIPIWQYKFGYLYGVLLSWFEIDDDLVIDQLMEKGKEWFSLKLNAKMINITREALSQRSGLSLDEVDRGLKWLSEKDLIHISPRYDDKGFNIGLSILVKGDYVTAYFATIPKPMNEIEQTSSRWRNFYLQSWIVLSELLQNRLYSLLNKNYSWTASLHQLNLMDKLGMTPYRFKQCLEFLKETGLITLKREKKKTTIRIELKNFFSNPVHTGMLCDSLIRLLARMGGIFKKVENASEECVRNQWKLLQRVLSRISNLVGGEGCELISPSAKVYIYLLNLGKNFRRPVFKKFPEALIYSIREIYGKIYKLGNVIDSIESINKELDSSFEEISKKFYERKFNKVAYLNLLIEQDLSSFPTTFYNPEREVVVAGDDKRFINQNISYSSVQKAKAQGEPVQVLPDKKYSKRVSLLSNKKDSVYSLRHRKVVEPPAPPSSTPVVRKVDRKALSKSLKETLKRNKIEAVRKRYSKRVNEILDYWLSIRSKDGKRLWHPVKDTTYRRALEAIKAALNGTHTGLGGRKVSVEEIKKAIDYFTKKVFDPAYPPFDEVRKHKLRSTPIDIFIYDSFNQYSLMLKVLEELEKGTLKQVSENRDIYRGLVKEWDKRVNTKLTPIQERYLLQIASKVVDAFEKINEKIDDVLRIKREYWPRLWFDTICYTLYRDDEELMRKRINLGFIAKRDDYFELIKSYLKAIKRWAVKGDSYWSMLFLQNSLFPTKTQKEFLKQWEHPYDSNVSVVTDW